MLTLPQIKAHPHEDSYLSFLIVTQVRRKRQIMEQIDMNIHEYESIIQDLHAVRLFRKLLLDQMQWSSIHFVGTEYDFGLKDIHVTEDSFYKIIQALSTLDESRIKSTRSKDGRVWKSINYMDFNIFCITDKE